MAARQRVWCNGVESTWCTELVVGWQYHPPAGTIALAPGRHPLWRSTLALPLHHSGELRTPCQHELTKVPTPWVEWFCGLYTLESLKYTWVVAAAVSCLMTHRFTATSTLIFFENLTTPFHP